MDWDETYADKAGYFGPEPDRLVVEHVPARKRLRVLDVGAGQGRNCIPLARQGHAVTAIDSSSVALEQIQAVASREGLDITTRVADFRTFASDSQPFDVVLVLGLVPILDREGLEVLMTRLDEWTAAGGRVLLTAFTVQDPAWARCKAAWRPIGHNTWSNERGETRLFLELGEALDLFSKYEIFHYWEGLGPEHRHGDGPLHHHGRVELVARRHR